MTLSKQLRAFSGRIGHDFAQPELLRQALRHPSATATAGDDNQRLEFLGDRVLGLVMAETLYVADRSASEGQLAPRFNALVRKESCAEVARSVGLGEVLKLGRSEMLSGGRRKDAILGDAMEAVIAAVYLDAGFDAARDMVQRLWQPLIASLDSDMRDPKTALQEWAQARGQSAPIYLELERSGPSHAPLFTIEVQLADGARATASAGSKRQAEKAAAKTLLQRLEGQP